MYSRLHYPAERRVYTGQLRKSSAWIPLAPPNVGACTWGANVHTRPSCCPYPTQPILQKNPDKKHKKPTKFPHRLRKRSIDGGPVHVNGANAFEWLIVPGTQFHGIRFLLPSKKQTPAHRDSDRTTQQNLIYFPQIFFSENNIF